MLRILRQWSVSSRLLHYVVDSIFKLFLIIAAFCSAHHFTLRAYCITHVTNFFAIRIYLFIGAALLSPVSDQGAVLTTVGRSYIGYDVTRSTLLDRACACSCKNFPKRHSYCVSFRAQFHEADTDLGSYA